MNHIEPTHLLGGSVTEFYGDYRAAGASKAILGMELHLIDDKKEGKVILRRSYHKEVSLADQSPDALAGGLTQAVHLVLVDFGQELAAVARQSAATPSPP
jgi:hypothetical protein